MAGVPASVTGRPVLSMVVNFTSNVSSRVMSLIISPLPRYDDHPHYAVWIIAGLCLAALIF